MIETGGGISDNPASSTDAAPAKIMPHAADPQPLGGVEPCRGGKAIDMWTGFGLHGRGSGVGDEIDQGGLIERDEPIPQGVRLLGQALQPRGMTRLSIGFQLGPPIGIQKGPPRAALLEQLLPSNPCTDLTQ